jgi:DNA polymerase
MRLPASDIHDLIEMETGRGAMDVLSKALRAQFIAAPGHVFYGADFSNVEGRINAWMADEEWKLQAFRDYDAGRGADLYRVAFSKAFGVPVSEVDSGRDKGPQRQIGKTQELACGYQGSVGAWLRFDPDPKAVTKTIMSEFYGTEAWRKAADQHDRASHHLSLTADQWISVKIVINGWRDANSRIVQSWWNRQDAVIAAVEQPGTKTSACGGKVRYLVAEGFLWAQLPSGKLLAYSRPRLREKKDDWLIDDAGNAYPADEFTADEIALRIAAGAVLREGQSRLQVVYDGKNQKTNAWGGQTLYGGVECNNDVQGTARELLRFAMGSVERAGYPIVLHVHDELVSEVQKEFGSAKHYESLMSILPPWLAGLPLAAKAWKDTRYVK